ncbi:YhjD/YihY/BrkB family envelope integrity protein [Thermocrinis sp.]
MGELGYYSSAMTYKFLMVCSSFIMLLGFLSSFLPFLNPDRVFELINQLMPKYASSIFEKLQSIYKHRSLGTILSVLISYFFVVSYAKMFAKFLSNTVNTTIKLREVVLWVFIPIYLLFFSFTTLVGSAFISIMQTILPKWLSVLLFVAKMFIFLPLIYLLYWFFLRSLMKPLYILEASIYFLLTLNIINFVFSKFFVKLVSLNPLYGLLGSLLLFLIWLELVFSFLLGAVLYAKRLN